MRRDLQSLRPQRKRLVRLLQLLLVACQSCHCWRRWMAEQEQWTPRSPWRDIMLSSVVSITNVMPSRNSLKPECTATKYLGQGMRQGGRATPRHRLSKRKRGQRHVARHDVFAFVFGQALTPSSDPPDARQLHKCSTSTSHHLHDAAPLRVASRPRIRV